jgi:hypothetical protein
MIDSHDHYWKLAEYEQHFNKLQTMIRQIASGWLLVAFTAIAVLLGTGKSGDYMFPSFSLIIFVCAMGSTGFLVLWIVDQLVYQRLLNAVATVALKMEFDDDQLPPIRMAMAYSAKRGEATPWLRRYYTFPIWTFFSISAVSTGITMYYRFCGKCC